MKITRLLITLIIQIVLISYPKHLQGQSENPRKEKKFGLNLILLGPTALYSFSANYFATPTIDVEAGLGAVGFFAGGKYHFKGNSDKKLTPYLGIYGSSITIPEVLGIPEKINSLYIPLGLHYIRARGFTCAVETSVFVNKSPALWGAIKVGHHF